MPGDFDGGRERHGTDRTRLDRKPNGRQGGRARTLGRVHGDLARAQRRLVSPRERPGPSRVLSPIGAPSRG